MSNSTLCMTKLYGYDNENVLFDHKYMYVHNILYFRKCIYKSVWRLLLRQNMIEWRWYNS